MERHEIPTHLNVADRAVLGLTMRQLLSAAVGLALAYGALSDLPLPFAARLPVAGAVVVATAILVLWRPAGRAAEEWAFVLLRFWATPRIAVWRRRAEPPGSGGLSFEVVLPSRAAGRGSREEGGRP